MNRENRLKVNNVAYRKGYIEVMADIHDACINIETWGINADIDIFNLELDDFNIPDEAVVANTELELNIIEAEQLIKQLQNAILEVKKKERKI
ncbi:MAG: hypothetical protein QNJ38_24695 [Prochloraceae cyanobacterium]|nr:hypothetical protein [Prochloraceae cyanobacterium]